ncbi:hypothetical protein [Candidatus Poriferisodalis sp.]|uniref:hypothetical protein n=1 Tax=Candidatus Poriferisodalis sp. TaxID=3101277 RepID=UPI003B5B8489
MTRRALETQFSTPGETPWKTLVLEAHPGAVTPHEYLADVFGEARVRSTDDAHLHELTLDDGVKLTVDDLDGRFWSFHSASATQSVLRAIRTVVSKRRDLDYLWLPTQHLRGIRPGSRASFVKADFTGVAALPEEAIHDLSLSVRGHDAAQLLEVFEHQNGHGHVFSIERLTVPIFDPDLGRIEQAVNRRAHFVARGDSFPLHQQVVADVVGRYRLFVEAVEERTIRFASLGEPGGGTIVGTPIEIQFSRPLSNLQVLFDELLSSGEPFRLWGMYEVHDSFGECDAVDLHVGGCMRIEAQPEFMRVQLFDGSCGNSIARLVSNLQHHVDGALRLVDPELDLLLNLEVSPATV